MNKDFSINRNINLEIGFSNTKQMRSMLLDELNKEKIISKVDT
jgi:hypothetical protein